MAKDTRISDIFYYFEQFSTLHNNRTIGRKIGVMQEIMLRKYLMQSPVVAERILLEHSVEGHSGATHKLEFLICNVSDRLRLALDAPLQYGGIEMRMLAGQQGEARIAARWLDDGRVVKRESTIREGESWSSRPLLLRFAREGLVARLTRATPDSVELALIQPKVPLLTVESKRVGAQRFADSERLGAGIQTIEKAKQAALVAIDVDLRLNGMAKPQSGGQWRRYLSVVVLGNGIHWEAKSKAVLATYVDHVYLVPDASIIRYCEFVRGLAQQQGSDFLPFYMAHFSGMTRMEDDGFVVSDVDFVQINGSGSSSSSAASLLSVVEGHIASVNQI